MGGLTSTAAIFAHWSADQGHLVDVRNVLQLLDDPSVVRSRSDGMHDVHARVAVRQAAVGVGRDFKFVGMANLHQLVLNPMLIVNDEVAFNDLFILHGGYFAPLLHFRIMNGSIPQKFTSVLVP